MKRNHPTHLTEGYEVSIARSVAEVEKIRHIWKQMQGNEPYPTINADINRYLSVLKVSGNYVRPYVMVLRQNGQPAAMMIGRIERRQLGLKLGYKTLFRASLNCLTVIHGGFLGQPDNNLCQFMIGELMRVLRRERLNAVYFNRLKTDSDVYQSVRAVPGLFSRPHFPEQEKHWTMTVPKDIESFYKALSKKHRGNIRRSIKKLETEYADNVKLVNYNVKDGLDQAIKAAQQISLTTYQYGLGCGFVDDSRTRSLLTTAAKQGWLRFAALLVEGEPCAFQIGLRYQGTYFLQQIGFEPRWSKFNVGTILFVKVLEHICADPGIEHIDFGFGDADYKRSYGDTVWQEASVFIFAMRPYPMIVNILQATTMALNTGLKYVANKACVVNWAKRRWRNLLQKGRRR
jgi:hypothetical protein